jgi:hypothetical protein
MFIWGNSTHAERVFKIQKRVIRIMKGCGYRESCREQFRNMNIFPLRSQYIYSLLMFVVKNREVFDTNRNCYEIMTERGNLQTINMADVDNLYVDRSEKTAYFNEEPGTNTCLKCIYLEEYLQVVLSELNSIKLAVKLAYADSNTVGPVRLDHTFCRLMERYRRPLCGKL